MPNTGIILIQILSKRCREDEISVYAAQASFFLVLAAFPFFLLLFSLSRKLPLLLQTELFSFLSWLVPKELSPLLLTIFRDLYESAPTALCSVSALTALWSASRGMLGIERGFFRIFRRTSKAGFFKRRFQSALFTLMLLVLCLFSLLILVFGSVLQELMLPFLSLSPAFSPWLSVLRFLFSLLFLIFSFTVLYSVVPQTQTSFSKNIAGAVLASAGWLAVSVSCSLYFQLSRQFTRIYGQLASLALLMLWLYFCLWCLFLGAEFNHLRQQTNERNRPAAPFSQKTPH